MVTTPSAFKDFLILILTEVFLVIFYHVLSLASWNFSEDHMTGKL